MTSSVLRSGFWGLSVLLLASALPAQRIAIEQPQLREGWHTVRPGETLESITAHYLGSSERWRKNWELNSDDVADPDLIYPGQRLRILLEAELPADGALISKLARTVEDQLAPFDWSAAEKNDLLRPNDQVRTMEDASAELLFFDNTHLILTEKSLMIVGESERVTPEIERAQIEIVLGQADLAGKSTAAVSQEIEIVLDDAVAKPQANPEGVVETRARRPREDGAQVMVYSGESEVAAAGAQITGPQGMGSAVPEGEPPSTPEKLLDAPADLEPAAGSRWSTPKPVFRWSAIDGAGSYTVEVCRDESCGEVVERVLGLSEPTRQAAGAGLPVADYFWRVTAVSASGLDGYPSNPVPFVISSTVEDRELPTVAVRFPGLGTHRAPGSTNAGWSVRASRSRSKPRMRAVSPSGPRS